MNGTANAAEAVARLAAAARERAHGSPVDAELADLAARLDGPLRVAIAGRVKAGKSTLLNALVGERLAPTDAGECTTLVSWYRDGVSYDVHAVRRDGSAVPAPFTRRDGGLVIDVGRFDLGELDHLDISWPTSALRRLTLIDTPGLASLHDEHSVRTREFLAMGEDRPSDADAVIYLMRHLHQRDAEFLGAFCDRGVVASSPVNAVAVLARADEIGAGRLDALESAARVAARYDADPDVRALCSTVIPVAGLIAETGQTWREEEAAALRALAATPRAVLELMLVSVDELLEPSASELTVEQRRNLLGRLGMYGLRFLITEVAAGRLTTAGDMARALVARSGLDALRRHLSERFLPRAQLLKARSVLHGLRTVAHRLAETDPATARWLSTEVERLEAGVQEFGLLRLGHLVATGLVPLHPDEAAEVERMITGGPVASRLGSPETEPPDSLRARALEGVERWRLRGTNPLADGAANEAAQTMARAYEALYLELTAPDRAAPNSTAPDSTAPDSNAPDSAAPWPPPTA